MSREVTLERTRGRAHHLGLAPDILLAVGHSAAQRRCLHILTPVGGASGALLSPQQGGRCHCEGDKRVTRQTRHENKIPGCVTTAPR